MITAPCCERSIVVAIRDPRILSYERVAPRATPSTACLSCGSLDIAGIRLSDLALGKLRALNAIADRLNGSAEAFGFPTLAKIVPFAKNYVINTVPDGRIDLDDLNGVRKNDVLRAQLRARIEEKMRLRLATPRAIPATGLDHPVIMHIGLAHKFVNDDHLGPGHIRFVKYVAQVLKLPIEIWHDLDKNRLVYRIIGALVTGEKNSHFMHVLVEAESHILTTAYTVDVPARIETYRTGTPLQLYWAT